MMVRGVFPGVGHGGCAGRGEKGGGRGRTSGKQCIPWYSPSLSPPGPRPYPLRPGSPEHTTCPSANTAGIPTPPKRRSAYPGEPARSAAANVRRSLKDGMPSAAGHRAVRYTGAKNGPRLARCAGLSSWSRKGDVPGAGGRFRYHVPLKAVARCIPLSWTISGRLPWEGTSGMCTISRCSAPGATGSRPHGTWGRSPGGSATSGGDWPGRRTGHGLCMSRGNRQKWFNQPCNITSQAGRHGYGTGTLRTSQ
jgi:hypothetical protein